MTANARLRAAIAGLIGLAATEEQLLLAGAPDGEQGSQDRWAAVPLVAHNTEYRQQQVIRLQAVSDGSTPPDFAEVDHRSADTYQRYCAGTPAHVALASRQSARALIDGLYAVADADLTDASAHPWLRGRTLWLQVVVRGFWHPAGHVGDYYVGHGLAVRAVALHSHALATASYLDLPGPVLGMASYSLACAQAQAGETDAAASTLASAIGHHPGLAANAGRDPDLSGLRASGRLDALLSR
jgi:hypothetical protein